MFSLFRTQKTTTATINGTPVPVGPQETLLLAALRHGIDFPHSCRVGGCKSWKCRLEEGKVHELTETDYILSDEELGAGCILACQSVPVSDVRISVELAAATRRTTGRVVAQTRLPRDITRLVVGLDEAIDYRAGQFAGIGIASLPGVMRSYSFASAPGQGNRVAFLVRKVPGGRFSSRINDEQVTGEVATIDGPMGDFWLRDGTAPLLMVAGGSGLAPILAMLGDAAAHGDTRPVTLLFGAREQQDLYALDEIDLLRRRWHADFRFVPVLSGEPAGSDWRGERGLATDRLDGRVEPGAHAYLCGPPAMIDSAAELLAACGAARENIHSDRFTTLQDTRLAIPAPVADAGQRPVAGLLDYLKYFLFHVIGLLSLAGILAGGGLTAAALVAILAIYLVGDGISGDDTSTPRFLHPRILTVQLWLALPLLSAIVLAAVWSVCPGDPLGFGAFVAGLTGYDVLAARATTGFGHHVSAFILTGLMIGMIGTITAHELTHRTWDPVSMLIGRWLLAFSFDTIFAIEHVYGHHRYVSTVEDPATAPRGRNVYHHVVASTIKGNISAWRIERRHLARKGRALFSWHNAVLRGHGMSLLLVAAAWALGGWTAAAFFAACALWGKALLEIVNYMEHYGMVRNPETPAQPRHSWNTNKRISSWSLFNLTRHSHHHAQGEVPYQDLKPFPDAPMMISGYLTTIIITLIPPLWHRPMAARLLAWDRDYATGEEQVLAARANRNSGIPQLQAAVATGA